MRTLLMLSAGALALGLLGAGGAREQRCHPSYPDFCIAPPPPDLDCADVRGPKPFRVRHDVRDPDPHRFDRDRDGRACEPRPRRGA
ncbi:MAG TPA: hypothetical protein VF665_18460 [Longimicrobium sp.]|jgi:hypothetical protein|uniref:hypothetical protein n=1 Tax=Longimicrobium sp. TaxID=2029185 RepID=UPI002ED9DE27